MNTLKAGVYQIRGTAGCKIAEFANPDEARYYLRKQIAAYYEVWTFEGKPKELVGIQSAKDFIGSKKDINAIGVYQ